MERHTILSLQNLKKERAPIVAATCYDAWTARLLDQSGVDLALVGDSVANTRLGYSDTIPVTMEEMLHHVRSSARGVKRAFLVADMPFSTYEAAPWQAAVAAGRFVKEGGARAVKLEGGARIAESVKAILKANVPVMGHLGLTPQSVIKESGYRIHGRGRAEATAILRDALLLEKLGVFSLVLEGVPETLARTVTRRLRIPTIGIGAGSSCDGQVLVLDDLLGLSEGRSPKFVKKFADLRPLCVRAVSAYAKDVRARRFPTKAHTY